MHLALQPLQSATLAFTCSISSSETYVSTGKLTALIDEGLADVGFGTLRARLPNEQDKDYERNTTAALLLKSRQV